MFVAPNVAIRGGTVGINVALGAAALFGFAFAGPPAAPAAVIAGKVAVGCLAPTAVTALAVSATSTAAPITAMTDRLQAVGHALLNVVGGILVVGPPLAQTVELFA